VLLALRNRAHELFLASYRGGGRRTFSSVGGTLERYPNPCYGLALITLPVHFFSIASKKKGGFLTLPCGRAPPFRQLSGPGASLNVFCVFDGPGTSAGISFCTTAVA
jgi:hypothetical protein